MVQLRHKAATWTVTTRDDLHITLQERTDIRQFPKGDWTDTGKSYIKHHGMLQFMITLVLHFDNLDRELRPLYID